MHRTTRPAAAPSLLLVGRPNAALLDLNRAALPLLAAERRLADLGDPSELPPLLIAWLEGHGAAADAERAVGAA